MGGYSGPTTQLVIRSYGGSGWEYTTLYLLFPTSSVSLHAVYPGIVESVVYRILYSTHCGVQNTPSINLTITHTQGVITTNPLPPIQRIQTEFRNQE